MDTLGVSWLNGYGEVKEVEVNGNAAAATQAAPPIQQVRFICDLPKTREGQRLVRVADWCASGPYWLCDDTNGRILRGGISTTRAVEYLRDLGLREFDIDTMLYHSELWARRQGSQRPLYGLRDEPEPVWDVWTSRQVGGRVE